MGRATDVTLRQKVVNTWNVENLRKRNASKEFNALIKQINVNVHMVLRFYGNAKVRNESVQLMIKNYCAINNYRTIIATPSILTAPRECPKMNN